MPASGKKPMKAMAESRHDAALAGTASTPSGFRLHSFYLDRSQQAALVAGLREVFAAAPLFTPRMPKSGRPFSVRMSNCGPLGWVSDERGYRYAPAHPVTGTPWPPMPQTLLHLWEELADYPQPPEACLINYYGPGTKMGLHQDRDEQDFAAPVVSVSLGDSCLFRLGGTSRSDRTRSFRLTSGDVVVLGGDSRLVFHGVDRIESGTSTLLAEGGRINLTLRRVTRPGSGTAQSTPVPAKGAS
jgi:alkylated DNA repair protein (DNA oxidative demethylase)